MAFFSLFWWVQMFGLYLLDSILFFRPSFSHLICYFNYFFAIEWHFSNSKKGSFVHLVQAKYIWVNSCF